MKLISLATLGALFLGFQSGSVQGTQVQATDYSSVCETAITAAREFETFNTAKGNPCQADGTRTTLAERLTCDTYVESFNAKQSNAYETAISCFTALNGKVDVRELFKDHDILQEAYPEKT